MASIHQDRPATMLANPINHSTINPGSTTNQRRNMTSMETEMGKPMAIEFSSLDSMVKNIQYRVKK